MLELIIVQTLAAERGKPEFRHYNNICNEFTCNDFTYNDFTHNDNFYSPAIQLASFYLLFTVVS